AGVPFVVDSDIGGNVVPNDGEYPPHKDHHD
ncbi:unnamed protein product, partial [Adineta steineri]